jgi:hypothetical protein
MRLLAIAIILGAMCGWAIYSAPYDPHLLYSDGVDVDWLVKVEQAKQQAKVRLLRVAPLGPTAP